MQKQKIYLELRLKDFARNWSEELIHKKTLRYCKLSYLKNFNLVLAYFRNKVDQSTLKSILKIVLKQS